MEQGALGPLFPGVHHAQIPSPNDVLSTWRESIFFCFLPRRRLKSTTRPSSPKYLSKGIKKKKPQSISKAVFPALLRQTAVGDSGSQLFFHLNENPQPALSSFVHWKMPNWGLDLIQGQVSAGTHETEAPGPAITVDLEIQGMGEGVDLSLIHI